MHEPVPVGQFDVLFNAKTGRPVAQERAGEAVSVPDQGAGLFTVHTYNSGRAGMWTLSAGTVGSETEKKQILKMQHGVPAASISSIANSANSRF